MNLGLALAFPASTLSPAEAIDQFIVSFAATCDQIYAVLHSNGWMMFGLLATLDLIRIGYDHLLNRHGDAVGLLFRVIKWILYVGGIYLLTGSLVLTRDRLRLVLNAFRDLGEQIAGTSDLSLTGLFDQLFGGGSGPLSIGTLVTTFLDSPINLAIVLFLFLGVIVVVTYISFLYIKLVAEAFLALAVSPIFAVLAVNRFTIGFTDTYLSYFLRLSFRFTALYALWPFVLNTVTGQLDAIRTAADEGPSLIAWLIQFGTAGVGSLIAGFVTPLIVMVLLVVLLHTVMTATRKMMPEGKIIGLESLVARL